MRPTRPLQIAHSIHGLGLGGAQQVIKFLVQERRQGAFEHRVYSCHGGVFVEPIEAAGARVRILPRRIPKFDPFWVRSLARAMEEDGIDVVHGHLFGDSLHAYLAARRAGLSPMVMTLHNSVAARSGLQLRGYRWLLGQQTRAVACAEFVRSSFVEHMGPVAEQIETIANGIAWREAEDSSEARARARRVLAELGVPCSADPAAAKNPAGEPVVLGTVGRLAEQKAYPLLLEALADLDGSRADRLAPAHLVLFGDGPLRTELEARCRELGLAERVTFAGFRDDVPSLLPGLDGVVFSSLFEGLPIALIEAMAAARAVVATRVGGMPDALDDEESALLVPPRDVSALGSALARVIGDPALRKRLGEGARRRFEAEFTARAMVERYEELYTSVAAGRRRVA